MNKIRYYIRYQTEEKNSETGRQAKGKYDITTEFVLALVLFI